MNNKFIITKSKGILMGVVMSHYQIAEKNNITSGIDIISGGWYELDEDTKTCIFYGSSYEYGKACDRQIKEAHNKHEIYLDGKNIYHDYAFSTSSAMQPADYEYIASGQRFLFKNSINDDSFLLNVMFRSEEEDCDDGSVYCDVYYKVLSYDNETDTYAFVRVNFVSSFMGDIMFDSIETDSDSVSNIQAMKKSIVLEEDVKEIFERVADSISASLLYSKNYHPIINN